MRRPTTDSLYEGGIDAKLYWHTYWKERFWNRKKLRDGKGKSYGRKKTILGYDDEINFGLLR